MQQMGKKKKRTRVFSFNRLFLSIHHGPDLLHWSYKLKKLTVRVGVGQKDNQPVKLSEKIIPELSFKR